jgi:predicted PurR-regulated permease PerM
MKQVLKYTGYILLILVIGFLIWRFYYIIIWLLVAAMLSFIGQPMVKFFNKIHIRKLKMPRALSALLALLVIVLFGAGFVAVFIPLIVNQAQTISSVDVNRLAENMRGIVQWLNDKMHLLGAIPDGQTIQDFLVSKVKSVISIGSIGLAVGKFFNVAGNALIGLFSILFISFFFLKDENLFQKGLLLFIPEKHHTATIKVVEDSKHLLIRYYLGVLLEVLVVMSLIAIGLWIFGIKNALLIGFFAALMNIIPYIGPIIGGVIGLTLGIVSTLSAGSYNEVLPVTLKLLGTLTVTNIIDNNLLVPFIYSKSVKSHPLEIFLIIIIGGGIAGFLGMLFAVPVYTLLRVIAREFFHHFSVVRKLTDSIDEKEQNSMSV